MHSFKKIIKTIIVLAVCVALLVGLDLALYPCTFFRKGKLLFTPSAPQREVRAACASLRKKAGREVGEAAFLGGDARGKTLSF